MPSLRRHVARQIKEFRKNRARSTTLPWTRVVECWRYRWQQCCRFREWTVLDVAKLTEAAVVAVGKEGRPAAAAWFRRRQNDVSAGRNAGSLRCGVAARFRGAAVRVCHDVLGSFLNFKMTPRMLGDRREVNETVFALNFMETGGVGRSESCEKVEYSILSTDLASPALHRLHFVISDFRPPSVAESGEAALRRLLASRAWRLFVDF